MQIASLTAKKGHADAIRAFAMSRPGLPRGSTFNIIGSEQDVRRADLAALAASLDAADAVLFRPSIRFDALHEELSRYHVFLHPSKYSDTRDCEGGAPVVILDALACGLPVVSTRHCDIPDEVEEGLCGFLAEEGCVESVVEAIGKMAALSDDEFESMRRSARTHVEQNFDARRNGMALREIYEECLVGAEHG